MAKKNPHRAESCAGLHAVGNKPTTKKVLIALGFRPLRTALVYPSRLPWVNANTATIWKRLGETRKLFFGYVDGNTARRSIAHLFLPQLRREFSGTCDDSLVARERIALKAIDKHATVAHIEFMNTFLRLISLPLLAASCSVAAASLVVTREVFNGCGNEIGAWVALMMPLPFAPISALALLGMGVVARCTAE